MMLIKMKLALPELDLHLLRLLFSALSLDDLL